MKKLDVVRDLLESHHNDEAEDAQFPYNAIHKNIAPLFQNQKFHFVIQEGPTTHPFCLAQIYIRPTARFGNLYEN